MKRLLLSLLSIIFLSSCGCHNNNPDVPTPIDPGGSDGPIDPINPPEPEEEDIFDRTKAKEWAMTFPKEDALPNKITCTWKNNSDDDKSKEASQSYLMDYGASEELEGSREIPSDEISDVIETIKTGQEKVFNLNGDTFETIFNEEAGIKWVFSKDENERLVAQEGSMSEGHSLIYNHKGYLVAYYSAVNTKQETKIGTFNIIYVVSEQFNYNA